MLPFDSLYAGIRSRVSYFVTKSVRTCGDALFIFIPNAAGRTRRARCQLSIVDCRLDLSYAVPASKIQPLDWGIPPKFRKTLEGEIVFFSSSR